MHARSFRLRPALCNPQDCSSPGSSNHGIFQARILEWVAKPSSRGSFWPKDRTRVSWGSCIAGRFFTAEPPGKPLYTLLLPSFFPDENACFILEKSDSLPGVTYQVREKPADAFSNKPPKNPL